MDSGTSRGLIEVRSGGPQAREHFELTLTVESVEVMKRRV